MLIHLKKLLKIILPSLIAIVLIMGYGKYRCDHPSYKDPLETQLVLGLDGWSLTHFIFFAILGYFYPAYFWYAFICGVAWELFEHFYGVNRPGWLGGYGDCNKLQTDREDGNWWYGKWTDIVANSLGFIVGAYLRNKKLAIL